jgi:predicted dehydrogenase
MRIGLIGTGYWAREVHGAGAARHPRLDLVGVWGRDAAHTQRAAAELETRPYADLDALLGDVEALTFAVPPQVQAEIATRAARAGKHLVLDKPIASSVEEARELERAAQDAGIASIVFFTRRFTPETAAWLQQVQEAGDWDCGRAEFLSQIFVPDGPFAGSAWRREKGALWDIGPHALSLLWPLLGDVTQVFAGGGRGDQVHLMLRHVGGRSSTASLSLTVPLASTGSSMYVYGEGGRQIAPLAPVETSQVVAAYQRAVDELLRQVTDPGSGHPCDVHFGARVVEVLAAAVESQRTGRVVEVERRLTSV